MQPIERLVYLKEQSVKQNSKYSSPTFDNISSGIHFLSDELSFCVKYDQKVTFVSKFCFGVKALTEIS